MAWQTALAPGEEILVDGKIIIRRIGRRIEVDTVPGAPISPIVKRPDTSGRAK